MTHPIHNLPPISPNANIWAIPLSPAFDDPSDQSLFLNSPSIDAAHLPLLLRRHLPLSSLSLHDALLWLNDDTILAVSHITYLNSSDIHWSQVPIHLSFPLRPSPRFQPRLLDQEERERLINILKNLNNLDQFSDTPTPTLPEPTPTLPEPPEPQNQPQRPLHQPIYTRYTPPPPQDNLQEPKRLKLSRPPQTSPPTHNSSPTPKPLSPTPTPTTPPPTTEPTPQFSDPTPQFSDPTPQFSDFLDDISDNISKSHQESPPISPQKSPKSHKIKTICEIFSGPPGTGKTYRALHRALELLLPNESHPLPPSKIPNTLQELQASGRLAIVTLHPNYTYESLVEGIRPSLNPSSPQTPQFALHFGPLKRLAFAAISAALPPNSDPQTALDSLPSHLFRFSPSTPAFVLIIDEINRGHLPQTLGETISLLEPSRRLSSPHELRLHLHHSPSHLFSLPPNLHILGTMNDADRSISPLDSALRRRFSFSPSPPDHNVIRASLESLTHDPTFASFTSNIFLTLNSRIHSLLSDHHLLGHTPWLNLRNLNDLRILLASSIIPLLLSHFQSRWPPLCLTLGCPYDDLARPLRSDASTSNNTYRSPLIIATPPNPNIFFNLDSLDFPPTPSFSLNPLLSQPSPPPLRSLILLLSSLLSLDPPSLRSLGQSLLSSPSSLSLPR